MISLESLVLFSQPWWIKKGGQTPVDAVNHLQSLH